MSNLAHPLAGILAQASQLPSTGRGDRYKKRMNPNSNIHVLLIDVSASMGDEVGAKTKIEILRQALDRPLLPNERAIAFNSIVIELNNLQYIPDPSGSTALHLAIDAAAEFYPCKTLVVCDGIPDDKQEAFATAEGLPGYINTLYIGEEGNRDAIAFMQELARRGCGTAHVCDLTIPTPAPALQQAIGKLHLLPPGN